MQQSTPQSWYVPAHSDDYQASTQSWYIPARETETKTPLNDERPLGNASPPTTPLFSRFPRWRKRSKPTRQDRHDQRDVARMADCELRSHMRSTKEHINSLELRRLQCKAMIKELQLLGHSKQIERIRAAISGRNTIFLIDVSTFSGQAWNSVGAFTLSPTYIITDQVTISRR